MNNEAELVLNFEAIAREVLANRDARTAYVENRLRRGLAGSLNKARRRKRMSVRDLARAMHSSVSEVRRLLHKEVGGSLALRTICRAADALDMKIAIHVRDRQPSSRGRNESPRRALAIPAQTRARTGSS